MSLTVILIAVVVVIAASITIIRLRKKSKSTASNAQVYVGNLHYRANEYELKDFFSRFGEVVTVRIVKDRQTRRSKGFAFITFATAHEATAATKMNGENMKGRTLVVRIAKPRE